MIHFRPQYPTLGAVKHDLADQLPYLSHALEEQRRFRTEQLAELAAPRPRDAVPSREAALRQVTREVRRAAQMALADIDAALARMDEGTYGRCLECASQIPVERLEILPMAALCMKCQCARENIAASLSGRAASSV